MHNTNDNKLYGVGCDVVNCRYNTQGRNCTAEAIAVESRNASKKVETFCGTFSPKAGSAE